MPVYISEAVDEEIARFRLRDAQKISDLQNNLILKIHYQLYVQQLEVPKTATLALCLDKARQIFNLSPETLPLHNSRLRLYNAVSDSKLNTYTGLENQTLEELGLNSFRSLLLETKTDGEQFEEFVPGQMTLRVAYWLHNSGELESLEDTSLRLEKISVGINSKVREVEAEIKKQRNNFFGDDGPICLINRHKNDEYTYHEIINTPEISEQTLQEIMIYENKVLFVEAMSDSLNWPPIFESEAHRLLIRYNDIESNRTVSLLTDNRRTIAELKA